MRELFIYYRALAVDRASVQAAVLGFQGRLREQFPPLVTRLLCRPETTDAQVTWMEAYSTDPGQDTAGVDPVMQAAIEVHATVLTSLLQGPRHAEVFMVCPTASG